MGTFSGTLVTLGSIPVSERGRVSLTKALQESGLRSSGLVDEGILFSAPAGDSYGRRLITPPPEKMELLVVSLLPRYAPAPHTHGPGTTGANLLCLEGSFYNVDYRIKDGIIEHDRIQVFKEGDVAFVSDNHIHRVVNAFDRPAMSLNVYWNNGNMSGEVGDKAFVFDAISRTRVTTSGPAFFFMGGDDLQCGLKFSSLVLLEDLVFQHTQLSNELKNNHSLPPDRVALLDQINATFGRDFSEILIPAKAQAESLIRKPGKTGTEDITAAYFRDLFSQVAKITNRGISLPELPKAERT